MSNNESSGKKKRGLPDRLQMRHGSHFVEELNKRTDASIGQMVPLSQIIPDPNQPRAVMGDLSDLVQSVSRKGVLEPILLRPHDEESVGRFKIISGERRYRAAMEAGLEDIPAIIMDVAEEDALEIALIENLQRKDLTAFEEAEGYRTLAEKYGYTHEEIARTVGKSRSLVTESFSLLGIPRPVREAANALGVTTKSTLLEILKVPNPEGMLQLLEEVASEGLSRDDLRLRNRPANGVMRQKAQKDAGNVYRYTPPDKSYSMALRLKSSSPANDANLITILEEIIETIRSRQR